MSLVSVLSFFRVVTKMLLDFGGRGETDSWHSPRMFFLTPSATLGPIQAETLHLLMVFSPRAADSEMCRAVIPRVDQGIHAFS